MELEGIGAVEKEYERVLKRQKTSATLTTTTIDSLLQHLNNAKAQLAEGKMDEYKTTVGLIETEKESKKTKFEQDQKEYHTVISKLGKAVDKYYQADVDQVIRLNKLDDKILNEAISQYLCRQGHFKLADTFAKEAGIEIKEEMKKPFAEMYHVLEAMKVENLAPALQWVKEHKTEDKEGALLEFKLHKLQFIQQLKIGDRPSALKYAKTHFAPFAKDHMKDIQRMMTAILFIGRLEKSPYSDLLQSGLLFDAMSTFSKTCCSLMGLSHESPLFVTINSGFMALPRFLKTASMMKGKLALDWTQPLPVQADLEREYQFHSIFTCPVSREQSTKDNPPVLLLCGHVLCKGSMVKLAKGNNKFKCPYCPVEQSTGQSMVVQF